MVTMRMRLFTGLIIITIAGFAYLTYWVVTDIRIPGLRGTEESLVECAGIMAGLVGEKIVHGGDSGVYHDLHSVFDTLYEQETGALLYGEIKEFLENRVYITDKKGIVLFDSYNGKDEGEDYSRWNDVYLTLRGRYGARTSRNDSFDPGTPYIYVGAPIKAGGSIVGVLSVGKPAGTIGGFIRRVQNRIIFIAVISVLLVAFVGIFLTLWISRPIEKLTTYARAVAKGETARMGPLGKGFFYRRSEVDTMGDAIEEMRIALEGRQYIEKYIEMLVHAIKPPLNGISAASEVLETHITGTDAVKWNRAIYEEAQSIQYVTDDLMDLVKLESRRTLEHVESVQVEKIVKDIIRIRAGTCKLKHISLHEGDLIEATVKGDRSLLEKAIVNIVENAIAFTPENGKITINMVKKGGFVSIIVEDTGAGIPDYALDRIFERYYSLPRPGTKKTSSGLGLNFVKEVASIHHGEITVKNQAGKGVRAVLKIPK